MSTMDLSTCAKRCFGKQGCGLTFGVTSALVEQISPAASDTSLKATRFPSLLALFFMIVVVILRSSVGVVFVVALVQLFWLYSLLAFSLFLIWIWNQASANQMRPPTGTPIIL